MDEALRYPLGWDFIHGSDGFTLCQGKYPIFVEALELSGKFCGEIFMMKTYSRESVNLHGKGES